MTLSRSLPDMPCTPSRACREDVEEICKSLPGTWLGTTWGDVPTWLVPHRDKGRGFVLYRRPHKTALDPETGAEYDDLLVIRTANSDDTRALVEADGPFFTIDHFRSYDAVLIQLSRLGEITRDELAEILTEAWLATAPKQLVCEFLG